MRKVGIVGFGKLGRFLYDHLAEDGEHEVAFVWNRSPAALEGIDPALVLDDLRAAPERADLIVEVAHPAITWEHGAHFLAGADLMVGSPTALARPGVLEGLRGRALYVPRGALPGLEEVQRLRARGALAEARITMRKHPASLKVADYTPSGGVDVVHDGPLRPLCDRAPNNVNTMAVLALASGLGFDGVHASLVADPSLEHHITEVELYGPDTGGPRFSLVLTRSSPAGAGAVTSVATLSSFLESVRAARGHDTGLHLC